MGLNIYEEFSLCESSPDDINFKICSFISVFFFLFFISAKSLAMLAMYKSSEVGSVDKKVLHAIKDYSKSVIIDRN